MFGVKAFSARKELGKFMSRIFFNNNAESVFFSLSYGIKILFQKWLLLKYSRQPGVVSAITIMDIHVGASNGELDRVKQCLLNGTNVNCKKYGGETALHIATRGGRLQIVECLLKNNANVEASNNKGETALHIATWGGQLQIVECLLKNNANVEASNKKGNTPLHVCLLDFFRLLKPDLANILVKNGADLFSRNNEQKTPYGIAKGLSDRRIFRMFKREMKTGLPKEVRNLRVDDVDSFKHALRSGFYYSYLGKIMLVGNEGVGKTAITAIIMGKEPSKTRISTEGIDVHISRAAVDLESRKLIPKDLSAEDVMQRNLLMRKRYDATSREFSTDDNQIDDDDDDDDDDVYDDDDTPVMFLEGEMKNQLEASNKVEYDELHLDNANATDTEQTFRKRVSLSFWTVLEKLGLKKKQQEKITTEMLKKVAIKAGKKGLHNMNLAPVIILDFAGQRVFYSTHQSFLTHRGIYVLTVNGSLQLDDEMKTESPIPGKFGKRTTRAYIEFWVSSILTYSKGRDRKFPKILVVCTHKDLVPVEKVTRQRSYIYGEIAKMFDGTPEMDHLVLDHQIFVNAMDPKDPEIEVLKYALVDIMFSQPSWGEKIPKPWINLEMVINMKIEHGETVLHRRQLEKINQENPIQILSNKDLEVFLKVHHSQGDIIYFPLPGLRDHIIIYPAYLVDALKAIITDRRFCSGRRLDTVNTMNKDGILTKAALKDILQRNEKFQHHHVYLANLMSHLDILAEPRMYHQGKLLSSEFFYVPSLVTKEDITSFKKQDDLNKRSMGLSFSFHSVVLPSAVGFRFISCCVEMYDVAVYENQKMLFSGTVVVDINKSLQMLVQVEKNRVDIFLIHDKSRFHITSDIASEMRECLKDTLYRISDSYKLSSAGPGAGIESVPFDTEYTCHHIGEPCYISQTEMEACVGKCKHGDDLTEAMKQWFFDKEIEDCSSDCEGVPQDALLETPSDIQLAKLVIEMRPDDFRTMLVLLEMTVAQIETIEKCYNHQAFNVMFVCLRKWRMKSRNRSLQDIYRAIEQAESNVHTLCKVFRQKPLDESFDIQERAPTDQDLDKVANHVIHESLLLAVHLGIDASYWLHKKENGYSLVDINRDVLRKWREEQGGGHGGRKMRDLAQACSNVGINIGSILSD